MCGEDEYNLDQGRFIDCFEHILSLVNTYPSGGLKIPDVELLAATARSLIAFSDLRGVGLSELQEFLRDQYVLLKEEDALPSKKTLGLVSEKGTKAQREIISALQSRDHWVSFQEIMEIRQMGNHGSMSVTLNDLVTQGLIAFWRDENDTTGDNRRWRAFR